MGATSKVIMGATLIMVVTLAMVLGLVFVLLAELYCSLLLRRRQLRAAPSAVATTNETTREPWHQQDQSSIPSLSDFYAQGVLQAPRSFLFPAVSSSDNVDPEKQISQPTRSEGFQAQQSTSSYSKLRLAFSSPSSPTSFSPLASPKIVHEVPIHYCSTGSFNDKEQFIYICNPIYDNEAGRSGCLLETPFETPDSSPSRLDSAGSSEEDDRDQSPPLTPPLSPMKKLPAEACSVHLRDARSLGTSGSDSNSNNGPSSSSSSPSPSTSQSW